MHASESLGKMKYTTVAALLPLASAANVNARQDTGIKFEVTDFTAACTSDSDYCWSVCLVPEPLNYIQWEANNFDTIQVRN